MSKSDIIRYTIKELGGSRSVANLCGLKASAVRMWAHYGRVPPRYLEIIRERLPMVDIGIFAFADAPTPMRDKLLP